MMAKKKKATKKKVKKLSNGGKAPKSKGDKLIEKKLDKRRGIIGKPKTYNA